MHEYTAQVHWQRQGATFTDKRYSRGHHWRFDGGITVPGSASPLSVRAPFSVAEAVDPEEAFVATISSCHMLWFLDIAARAGWVVDDCLDDAVGVMTANAVGKQWISLVTLRPCIRFAGEKQPEAAASAARQQGHAHRARGTRQPGVARRGQRALVVFQGAQGDVSPGRYASKQVHDTPEAMRAAVQALSTHFEAGQRAPWAMADAPADYIETMLGAIVMIELPTTVLVGKFKLSQNRSTAYRLGTEAGLADRGHSDRRPVAEGRGDRLRPGLSRPRQSGRVARVSP